MITLDILRKLFPSTKADILTEYVEPVNVVGEKYELFVNNNRIAGFLAQTGHESAGYRVIIENLNYSANGLATVFRKYFPTMVLAQEYARKPEKIANRVYANRMSNGDEASGDGWKFRGRGLIQLTGRDNYTRLAAALEMTIDETVEYLSTRPGAVVSAGWYWGTNNLNTYCDQDNFVGLTKRINGGTHGLDERRALYELALSLLQG